MSLEKFVMDVNFLITYILYLCVLFYKLKTKTGHSNFILLRGIKSSP